MAPFRRDLHQRAEHERAAVDLGMRQQQAAGGPPSRRPADDAPLHVDHVEIERSRAPMGALAAAGGALASLQEPQQHRGRYICLNYGDGVVEWGLTHRPHRLGQV